MRRLSMKGELPQRSRVLGTYADWSGLAGLICCFAALTCSAGQYVLGQAAGDWRVRLETEAPTAWQKYFERVKRMQFSSLRVTTEKGTRDSQYRMEFRQRDGMLLYLWDRTDFETKPPTRSIRLGVVNPRYGFTVTRRDEDKPWALEALVRPEQVDELPLPNPKKVVDSLKFVYIPSWLVGDKNPITHPNFKILKLTEVFNQEGGKVLRVDFEHTLSEGGETFIKQAWITLLPEKYWLIEEAQLIQPPSDVRIKHEYKSLADGFPVLHRRITRREEPDGSYTGAEMLVEWSDQPPPEEIFYLTHYGIPEPEELRWRRPVPWWLYILVAGMLLAMVGLGIYAWRRHRRAALA